MKDIECPYCGHDNERDSEQYESDTLHQYECQGCEKTFGYTIGYIPVYDTRPMPCANDGEHKFKPIIGAPREYFKDKFRCEYCEEERTIPSTLNPPTNE